MKPCNDCPFMKSSPLVGSPDWLQDVLTYQIKNKGFNHSCHKTDPKADGYKGSKKIRGCGGHLRMIMNAFDKTPGKGGVYESIEHMARAYLKEWGVDIPPNARLKAAGEL